jgi:hypothetical protein
MLPEVRLYGYFCQAPLALRGIRKDRRQMPGTEPLLGSVPQGLRLLVGPVAAHTRHAPCALGRKRCLVPPIPRLSALLHPTPCLLFFTQLPGTSHARAWGVRACPRWSWHRSAWRPALRSTRATGSVATWTRRAVARPSQPSPRWWLTDAACASGSFVVNKAVPRRSEPSSPHARQRRSRLRSWP